jgi:hypothetical protein
MSVPRPASHGTPLQLKGLSQALPCLCFDRDLSRHVVGEKVRFNTLNRATGNQLKRQMVDAATGEVVESEERIKGYTAGKGQYVTVEDDELANISLESTRTVDINKFVPKASIDDRYDTQIDVTETILNHVSGSRSQIQRLIDRHDRLPDCARHSSSMKNISRH